MTPDEHKAVTRRFFEEVWNQQRPEVIDEIFAPTGARLFSLSPS